MGLVDWVAGCPDMSNQQNTSVGGIPIDFAHVCKNLPTLRGLLSDNLPLSDTVDPAVAEYLLAARAPNTHRAYACDLADFAVWGGHIPSTPDEIARYIAQRACALRPSTLRRRLAALASIHRDRGVPDPTKATLVRRVVQGIERKHGTAVHQVAPLLIGDLTRIVATMGTSPTELRDKALLLVGFFGALRRSEIVALDVGSLAIAANGLALNIARSKTDQSALGRTVILRQRNDGLCPVRAVSEWLSAARISAGAVFRHIDASTQCAGGRLSDRAVARMIKRYARRLGIDAARYSGHSLRAGFVTSAGIAGFNSSMIARHTGHRTQQSLAAYARPDAPLQLAATP